MPAIVPAALALGGGLAGTAGATALGLGTLGTIAGGALGAGLGDVTGDVVTNQPITPLGVGLSAAGGGLAGGLGAAGDAASGASAAGAAPAAGAAAATAPAAGAGASLSDFASQVASQGGDLGTALGGATATGAGDLGTALGGATATGASDLGALGAVPASALSATTPSDLSAALTAAPVTATSALPSADALLAAPSGAASGIDITAAAPTVSGGSMLSNLLGTGGGATLTSGPQTSQGLLSGITGFAQAHPIMTAGAGLLASQALSPELANLQGPTSAENQLLTNAQPAINAANALIPDEATGTLPPGAQASVTNALNADIASIQSRYASLGMSGSSAEAQDIANAQNQSAALQFSLAQQATTTGLTALGLTNSVYTQLLQDQLTRQQDLQNAFANFAAAVGGASALSGATS